MTMTPTSRLFQSAATRSYLRRQWFKKIAFAVLATILVWLGLVYEAAPAEARGRHHVYHHREHHAHHTARHHRRDRSSVLDANGNGSGLVHVATAAGINITVAASFAPKIEGFIRDVVAQGYHPRQIHCYASGGHVRGSLHYRGEACDFDQRGWGKTARAMYHVAALAQQHGLRDGCTFRDCGHIDSGQALARYPWPRTLSARSHHRHRMAMR